MKKFLCAVVAAACIVSAFAFSGCSDETSVNYTMSEDGTYCVLSSVTGKSGLKEYSVPEFCVESDGALRPATEEDDAGSLIPVKEIGESAFFTCNNLLKLTLPEGLEKIGDLAFAYSGLSEITIPTTVTEIGASAFGACDLLNQVTIPDSVTTIGAMAFYACDGLEKVVIGNGIKELGYYVFANSFFTSGGQAFASSSLTEVHLPASLTKIDVTAFYGSVYLTDVYYDGTSEEFKEVTFYKMVKNSESGKYEEVALEPDEAGFYVNESSSKLNVTMHYKTDGTTA